MPCAWCFKEQSRAWPRRNPSSTICRKHQIIELKKLVETHGLEKVRSMLNRRGDQKGLQLLNILEIKQRS